MKKLIILLFVGLFLSSFAQKLQLTDVEGNPYTNGQTIIATITEHDLHPITEAFHLDIFVKNITENSLLVNTVSTATQLVDGMIAEVCFGDGCYSGEIVAIDWEIEGGGSALYAVHLVTNENFGLSKFKFEFTAEGETITLYAIIDMCGVGVKKHNNANVSLSAFPNPAPANSKINVSYTLADKNDNRLVIRNILGAEVMNIPLNPYENNISIDASNLKSGVYFYAIENRNQISIARKLIVK